MTTTTNSAAASVSAIIKKNCSYDLLSNTLTRAPCSRHHIYFQP